MMKWRKVTAGGLLVIWVAGFGWYLWQDSFDENPKNKAADQNTSEESTTATDHPSPSSQEKVPPPTEPIKLKQPHIKIINQSDTPQEALQVAAKFHWLAYLQSPIVSKEQIQYELFLISTAQVYRQLEITESDKEQKWKSIMVAPIRKKGEDWILNTVSVIDNKNTSLYLQLGKEDGVWKVRKLLKDPY